MGLSRLLVHGTLALIFIVLCFKKSDVDLNLDFKVVEGDFVVVCR